jgi:hypothetical protein
MMSSAMRWQVLLIRHQYYDDMIAVIPKVPYLPKAILKQKGLILYNQEKLNRAESVLKALVVSLHPMNAVGTTGLWEPFKRKLRLTQTRFPQFTQWLKSLNIDIFFRQRIGTNGFFGCRKTVFKQP